MSPRIAAACVHILTASGAVLGLLALMAAHAGAWQSMFGWLGVALAVDAVDGPLARYLKVNAVLPRFSGERLDLIIDYLTYVAVPAFVFAQADLLPEPFRLPAAAAILLSSLFHVADTGSKTREGYFVGFPAVWNIVLLYLFVLGLSTLCRACRCRALCAAHLRAGPERASVPCCPRQASDRGHDVALDRCGSCRRRQSLPVPALGAGAASRHRRLLCGHQPTPLA